MANKITCTCGHSWDKSDSSKKDAYVCHICGKDIKNMQLGGNIYPASYVPQAEEGWLSKYEDGGSMQEHQENYNDSSVSMGPGFVGMGNNTKGRNYSPAWGGQFEDGGDIPQAQFGELLPASIPLGNLAIKAADKISSLFSSSDKPKHSKRLSSFKEDNDDDTKMLGEIINIKDPRKIRKTTGQPINPNVDLVSGKYDAYLIKKALQDAKDYGISKEDAWNLAAIDFQETGWGKTDSQMGHVVGDQGGDTENKFLNAYLNKMKEADRLKITDPEMRLQVYNGLGLIKPETEQSYHKFKMKKIYGVPVPKEGLSMKKNPLYGKQIIDLRDNVLKQNPDVVSYIESLYGENGSAPKKAMGGSIPGSVGFTYARTQGIPSKGPHRNQTDVTDASAQNGAEMSFYQNGLDWTPKNISRDGSVIKDDRGQWAHPGEITEIGSNQITMKGVPYPVLGVSDEGDTKMMYPGEDYKFKGKKVTEYPVAQNGKTLPTVNIKKEPIYVDDPNDPRLRAYNDSLNLYNLDQNWIKAHNDESYNSWKTRVNYLAKNQSDYYDMIHPLLEKAVAAGHAKDDYKRLSNVKNQPREPVSYLSTVGGDKLIGGTGEDGDENLYRVFTKGYKKPTQPVKYKKPEVDQFGLIRDDYIQAHKGKFTNTPGSRKGDGYYELKKDGKSYKVYTQSGGNSWVDVPEKTIQVKKSVPKPELQQPIKKEEPRPIETKQNSYEGSPVYSGTVGSGLPSALVGFRNQQGDTTFIKPEDYERFGVPKYGKEYIESKTANKKKNGGWLEKYK